MSTTSLAHEPDSQEAMRSVYAAVLSMTADHRLPLPYGVGRNGAGSNLIAIELDSHDALLAWADTMRLTDVDREPHANPKTGKTHLHASGNWAGWRVNLSSDEPLGADLPRRVPGATLADTLALMADPHRDGHVRLDPADDLRHTMLVKATGRDAELATADVPDLPPGVVGFGTADILAAVETPASAA